MSNDLGSCHVGGKLLDELKKLKGTEVLRLTGEDGVSYGVFRWDAAILVPKEPTSVRDPYRPSNTADVP